MLRTAFLAIRSALVSIPIIVFATIIAVTAAVAVGAVNRQYLEAIRRRWAWALLAAAFVRVEATVGQPKDSTDACIICSNHLSYMDPPVLIAALPMALRFVAKESLFRMPFLGWGMRAAGDIPLDRDDPRAAARSLARAAALARSGQSLVIFPEGGRSLNGELQPFLSGAFRLAIQAQLPVVPVAIRGTREALRPGSLLLRGGVVNITFGEPIVTAGMTKKDQAALGRRVEEAVREML